MSARGLHRFDDSPPLWSPSPADGARFEELIQRSNLDQSTKTSDVVIIFMTWAPELSTPSLGRFFGPWVDFLMVSGYERYRLLEPDGGGKNVRCVTVGALDKECPPEGPDPGGFLI